MNFECPITKYSVHNSTLDIRCSILNILNLLLHYPHAQQSIINAAGFNQQGLGGNGAGDFSGSPYFKGCGLDIAGYCAVNYNLFGNDITIDNPFFAKDKAFINGNITGYLAVNAGKCRGFKIAVNDAAFAYQG